VLTKTLGKTGLTPPRSANITGMVTNTVPMQPASSEAGEAGEQTPAFGTPAFQNFAYQQGEAQRQKAFNALQPSEADIQRGRDESQSGVMAGIAMQLMGGSTMRDVGGHVLRQALAQQSKYDADPWANAERESKRLQSEADTWERRAQASVTAEDRRAALAAAQDARDRDRDMKETIARIAAGRERAPSGYRFGPDGSLTPIKGGPADPAAKPLPAAAAQAQGAIMNLDSGLAAYRDILNGYDPQGNDAISITKRAQLGTAFTDMQMRLKEAYELGAITGPDMRILEQALSNPTSLMGTAKGAVFGREPFNEQAKEVGAVLNRLKGNWELQHGRAIPPAVRPQASPPQAAPQQSATGKIGAPAAPKSDAEYSALPSGATYLAPDGQLRRKK